MKKVLSKQMLKTLKPITKVLPGNKMAVVLMVDTEKQSN
jgi:hypothetical protein